MAISKERILSHMNEDHRVSLYDFLAYYNGISLQFSDKKSYVELVDIENDKLILNYSRDKSTTVRSSVVKLEPPMSDLGDARKKLIGMAREAAAAFGFSPLVIGAPPKYNGSNWFLILVWITLFGGAAFPRFTKKIAGKLFDNKSLIQRLPQVFKRVIGVTFAIHVFEYFKFLRPILNKYRVYGSDRTKWMLEIFVHGFVTTKRLKAEIKRREQH